MLCVLLKISQITLFIDNAESFMSLFYQSMKSDDQESLDVDEAVDIDLPDVDMDPFSGIKPFLLSAIPLLLLFLLKVLKV